MSDSPEKIKRDWKEIVEKSGGTLMFCPDNLIEDVKVWNEKRQELRKEFERIAKIEIDTTEALNKAVYAIRQYLDEAGQKDVWTKEVGFQSEALKEGLYIVSVENK